MMTGGRTAILVLTLLVTSGPAVGEGSLRSEIDELRQARLFRVAIERLEAISETSERFAEAQVLLGHAYRMGEGVTQDAETAVECYRRASRLGDAEGMYQLGVAYEKGLGTEKSASAAFNWYDAAALLHPMAALRYAEIVLANQGNSEIVARHDPLERLRYAADAGVAKAKYLLAGLALRGQVSDVDESEAVALMLSATEEVAEANTSLGQLAHAKGRFVEAKSHFESALEMGDTSAAAYLGHYAEHGIGESIDRRRAFDLYEKAKGISWADEGRRRIATHYASIELFDTRIYGVPRQELRTRFADQGINKLSEEGYFDAFDASARLNDRDAVITVAYAPGPPQYVAEVAYQFSTERTRDSRNLYREAEEKLSAKYGEPERSGRKDRKRYLQWDVGDARIVLSHASSESKVHVTYQLHPYASELRQYVKQNEDRGDLSNAL